MPDLANRDELEKKLADKLGEVFEGHTDELLAELERVGWDVNRLDPQIWQKIKQSEIAIFIPFFEEVALQTAAAMLEITSIGVDWSLVNQGAADWARRYSTFLAGQIDATSRENVATAIRNSVAAYFEEGLNLGQLEELLQSDPDLAKLFTADVKDRLGRVYGPRRAQMIAVTETTRAAAQGEREYIAELRKQGVNVVEVWQTSADDLVCPICVPRDGKANGTTWSSDTEPPAHPNCRCVLGYELSAD